MKKRKLNYKEKIDYLRLARTENVGPITFHQLIRKFGTADIALNAIPSLASKGGRKRKLIIPTIEEIKNELEEIEKLEAELICFCEPDYPEYLREISDAPPTLTLRGHSTLLHKKQIGIVGARNASMNGRKMAERLTKALCDEDFVITSGLARGIDTTAHHNALQTGTIAAVAGGVDIVYPKENQTLYEQIIETGCVVSEQPLGSQPKSHLFPKRNRIISGLSLGIVVIEATKRSGSLITARMAIEQGREVFATPGSPLDPRAAGPNGLIKQGAQLVENVEDILVNLNSHQLRLCEHSHDEFEDKPIIIDENSLKTAREKILMNLSTSPIEVDELVRQCQMSLPLVLTILLELELAGRLDRQAGNQIALIG